jgi:RNA polymerase-binding transcription factor DksA
MDVDSELEVIAPALFTEEELARLRRRLLAKGRELAEILAELMAGQSPGAADLLDAEPGETKIEKVRRYLDLVDRAIKRVPAGKYGTCIECGRPLPRALLSEIPWTERCPGCAAS